MTEEHPYNNYTFYGATKIAGEQMFKALGHRYNLDWVGLRLHERLRSPPRL